MRQSVQCEKNIAHSTVVSLLRMRAEQQSCRVAYTFACQTGGAREVTYAELDQRARTIACMLADLGLQDQPVLLLYPPGLDYVAAFFGCLYAGAIAVPACPPDPLRLNRSLPRLSAVVRDAMPSAVLTTVAMSTAIESLCGSEPELSRLCVITTDDMPAEYSQGWEPAPVGADSIAVLQYTSGSTSAPKGVVLTHRNLMSNSGLIFRFFGHSIQSRAVSWLPPYHDMGLIGGIIQPLYGGFPMTLMPPSDFLGQPLRWLQEISRTGATTSGGPNFAYDLCVRKTTPAERMQLDLSSWRVAFNGSEPIRAETMETFAQAFAPADSAPKRFIHATGWPRRRLSLPVVFLGPGEIASHFLRRPCGMVRPFPARPPPGPAVWSRVASRRAIAMWWWSIRTPAWSAPPARSARSGYRAAASRSRTGADWKRPGRPSERGWPTPERGRSCAPAIWASCSAASCSSRAGSRT